MGGKPYRTPHDYPIFNPNSTLPILVRQVVFSFLLLLTLYGSQTLHNPKPYTYNSTHQDLSWRNFCRRLRLTE